MEASDAVARCRVDLVRESPVKPVGKPDAGNRHVGFDERGWEAGRRSASVLAPILDSTRPRAEMSLVSALQARVPAPRRPRQSVASGCGADTRVCRARTLAGACPWGGDEKCRLIHRKGTLRDISEPSFLGLAAFAETFGDVGRDVPAW